MHREEVFRFIGGIAEFLPQLHDDLVESASRAEIAISPDLAQQAVP